MKTVPKIISAAQAREKSNLVDKRSLYDIVNKINNKIEIAIEKRNFSITFTLGENHLNDVVEIFKKEGYRVTYFINSYKKDFSILISW